MRLLRLDPLKVHADLWPDERLYDKQAEIVVSVEENVETVVVAGNQLGKDWIAARVYLLMFIRALKEGRTCRLLNTSAKQDHLDVLWGEVGRAVATCRLPLVPETARIVGAPKSWVVPFVMVHHEIRRQHEEHLRNPLSYMKGMVAQKGESMGGHHADVTLFGADEASSMEDEHREHAQGWAKRFLFFGNAWPCENYFKKAVRGGDLARAA